MSANVSVPCVACGRELQDALAGLRENQPYRGTAFSSRGHYGSTVFDPMDDSALEINVCDGCLLAAGIARRVLHHGYHGPGRRRVISWAKEASAISARRNASGIETEGHDPAEGHGAEHESPTGGVGNADGTGDAHTSRPYSGSVKL